MEPTKAMMDQPIFVRIDEYQDILDLLTLVRERLGKATHLLQSIHKIREEEELEINNWSRSLSELDRRVAEIDRLLFKPGKP